MSHRPVFLATVAIAAILQLGTSAFITPSLRRWNAEPQTFWPKLLLWNASASVPRGLYLLRSAHPLYVGELVAVQSPPQLAAFMAARGYLPRGLPLLKHIGALSGQTVCRHLSSVSIDGHPVAVARERDTQGRTLPDWQGCRTLRAGDVFLLNPAAPNSFDGRYFGVLSARTLTARAEPLWTMQEHSR
jgi:conjugative transfer signal peptidase TraF